LEEHTILKIQYLPLSYKQAADFANIRSIKEDPTISHKKAWHIELQAKIVPGRTMERITQQSPKQRLFGSPNYLSRHVTLLACRAKPPPQPKQGKVYAATQMQISEPRSRAPHVFRPSSSMYASGLLGPAKPLRRLSTQTFVTSSHTLCVAVALLPQKVLPEYGT